MSKPSNKKYSKEFRDEAVAHVRNSGKSISEVARQLGISQPTLGAWVAQAKAATPSKDLNAENERLKRELENLRKEHEILVKAAAFFAKRNA
jgi:transposase